MKQIIEYEGKFKLGDEVYIAYSKLVLSGVCDYCNGNYEVVVNNIQYKCEHCFYGKTDIFARVPVKEKINEITLFFGNEIIVKKVRFESGKVTYFKPEELFLTEEECQIECDKLNTES